MEALISQSDGRTVDVYISDAVKKPKESSLDAYNAICDEEYDIRLLPFGKGTENPGGLLFVWFSHNAYYVFLFPRTFLEISERTLFSQEK